MANEYNAGQPAVTDIVKLAPGQITQNMEALRTLGIVIPKQPLYGAGNPTSDVGEARDSYVDTASGNVWYKEPAFDENGNITSMAWKLTMPMSTVYPQGSLTAEAEKVPVGNGAGKIDSAWLRMIGSVTDGYIVESGSNSTGNYTKFADGTMICCGTTSQYTYGLTALGTTGFYVATRTIYFPAMFSSVSVPAVAAYGGFLSGVHVWFNVTGSNTSYFSGYAFYSGATGVVNQPLGFMAIGRWK